MLNASSFIFRFAVSLVMLVSTMIASGHMLGHLINKDTAKYEVEIKEIKAGLLECSK